MGGCCSCCDEPPPPPPPKQKKPTIGLVLSDIDNTLIHYDKNLEELGYERLHATAGENSDDEEDEILLQKLGEISTTSVYPTETEEENKVTTISTASPSSPSSAAASRKSQIVHKWRHKFTDQIIETYSVPPPDQPTKKNQSDGSVSINGSSSLRGNISYQSGGKSFVSVQTVKLISELREKHKVKFVLYSNDDYSTFVTRCGKQNAFPSFDFAVCEGGAKLFKNGIASATAPGSLPDQEWYSKFSSIFADQQQQKQSDKEIFPTPYTNYAQLLLPVEQRQGALWECYRKLSNRKPGQRVDLGENIACRVSAELYETAFVVEMFVDENLNSSTNNNSSMKRYQDENKKQNEDKNDDDDDEKKDAEIFEGEIKLRQFLQNEFQNQLAISSSNGGRKAMITAKGCTKTDIFLQLLLTFPELSHRDNNNSSSSNSANSTSSIQELVLKTFLQSIDIGTTTITSQITKQEDVLSKKQKQLADLMFLLEDGRQKIVTLQSDVAYWRKVIKEDTELIEMETDELDRKKSQLMQPYKSAQKNLLDKLQNLEQLVELRKKKLDEHDDNNSNDGDMFPEQLMDILEGSRLLLVSKDEQLENNSEHNVRMSKRVWGTGFLAFMGALTSEEIADEITHFSPENVPGFLQNKIFAMTDETPSFKWQNNNNNKEASAFYSSAELLAKWVLSAVDYFPKEQEQVFPARKKIKKKQRENKQRQDKIDANLKEIEEIEDKIKNALQPEYLVLKKEVKQLELLVGSLKLRKLELIERRETAIRSARGGGGNGIGNQTASSTTASTHSPKEHDEITSSTMNPLSSDAAAAANTASNCKEDASKSALSDEQQLHGEKNIQPSNKNNISATSPHGVIKPQRILTAALFDDQDDLDFVKFCDLGYAPCVSHPLVRNFLLQFGKSNNNNNNSNINGGDEWERYFAACPDEGLLGTEFALKKFIELCEAAEKC